MNAIQIAVLAVVQGLAELLPISSSAHVIVAEKLMGLDPTSPDMTLLLVMLHAGTMLAVIVYFWRSWRVTYFASAQALRTNGLHLLVATLATGAVGLVLLVLIKYFVANDSRNFEIEQLFGNTRVIAVALACAGALILVASTRGNRAASALTLPKAGWIGAVQGLCMPFRGFSRSGATISSGMLLGIGRRRAEEFSFALAVVLTPPVIAREGFRFYQAHAKGVHWMALIAPSALGMGLSFLAGLAALRWLSKWLENGRWYLFGIYCLFAAVIVWVAV